MTFLLFLQDSCLFGGRGGRGGGGGSGGKSGGGGFLTHRGRYDTWFLLTLPVIMAEMIEDLNEHAFLR